MSKKKKTIAILGILITICVIILFLLKGCSPKEEPHSHLYKINDEGTWICEEDGDILSNTDEPYVAVLENDQPKEIMAVDSLSDTKINLGNGKIQKKDNIINYYGDDGQTVIIKTSKSKDKDDELIINAPNDNVYHYGSATVICLDAVATTSHHEHGEVELVTMTVARLILENSSDVKEIYLDINNINYKYETSIIALKEEAKLPALTRGAVELKEGEVKTLAIIQRIKDEVETNVNTETNEQTETVKEVLTKDQEYVKIENVRQSNDELIIEAFLSPNSDENDKTQSEGQTNSTITLEEAKEGSSHPASKNVFVSKEEKVEEVIETTKQEETKEETKEEVKVVYTPVATTPVVEEQQDSTPSGPAHSHSYSVKTKTADCSAGGTVEYICSCGEHKSETLPVGSLHDFYVDENDDLVCRKCNVIYDDEYIALYEGNTITAAISLKNNVNQTTFGNGNIQKSSGGWGSTTSTIKYSSTSTSSEKVVIRTKTSKLETDSEKSTVYHYGNTPQVTLKNLSTNSSEGYYEYGVSTILEVNNSRIVLTNKKDSKINNFLIKKKDNNNFGNVVLVAENGASLPDAVYRQDINNDANGKQLVKIETLNSSKSIVSTEYMMLFTKQGSYNGDNWNATVYEKTKGYENISPLGKLFLEAPSGGNDKPSSKNYIGSNFISDGVNDINKGINGFNGGGGNGRHPYVISSLNQFKTLNNNTYYYYQLAEKNEAYDFSSSYGDINVYGYFDGNNQEITGLKQYLFRDVGKDDNNHKSTTVIKNLTINANIVSSTYQAILGHAPCYSTLIENVTIKGSIASNSAAAYFETGSGENIKEIVFKNCVCEAIIKGSGSGSWGGGTVYFNNLRYNVAGGLANVVLDNCSFTGKVISPNNTFFMTRISNNYDNCVLFIDKATYERDLNNLYSIDTNKIAVSYVKADLSTSSNYEDCIYVKLLGPSNGLLGNSQGFQFVTTSEHYQNVSALNLSLDQTANNAATGGSLNDKGEYAINLNNEGTDNTCYDPFYLIVKNSLNETLVEGEDYSLVVTYIANNSSTPVVCTKGTKYTVNDDDIFEYCVSYNDVSYYTSIEFDITKKNSGGGGTSECFTADTLITMADNSKKRVDELSVGDEIVTFDHLTGELSTSPVAYIYYSNLEYDVTKLNFENDISITILQAHCFYNLEENKYVEINCSNVEDYVGKHFYCVDTNSYAELIDYECSKETLDAYSVLSEYDINHVANGLLAISDEIEGLYNYFEYDANMKYDEQKMQADIEEYGLVTYDMFKDYCTEEEFEVFNCKYLGIAVAKGLTTFESLQERMSRFTGGSK